MSKGKKGNKDKQYKPKLTEDQIKKIEKKLKMEQRKKKNTLKKDARRKNTQKYNS